MLTAQCEHSLKQPFATKSFESGKDVSCNCLLLQLLVIYCLTYYAETYAKQQANIHQRKLFTSSLPTQHGVKQMQFETENQVPLLDKSMLLNNLKHNDLKRFLTNANQSTKCVNINI